MIVAFLLAATLGANLPAEPDRTIDGERTREIVLLEGLLHTDILLPATPDVVARFAFARGTSLPLDAPGLRWLSVGWGSHAFYTTAGTYADIRPSAVWRAATGDTAVIRLVGLGALRDGSDLRRLRLDEAGFEALLSHIEGSLQRGPDGRPRLLPDATIGPGDVFYHARGRFDLLTPCNEWTRAALHRAGLPTGRWTPTTFALASSIDRFAER